jgi:hypothetical protein
VRGLYSITHTVRKGDPDYDAVRARALAYLLQRGKLTSALWAEAMAAGEAELRCERRMARSAPEGP